ncbi:putative protein phosphatase 2C 14 [Morus notabilis]|uniref:protein-serine/threonine phosphatase n=1 Tax=Morus notabilis TaxID=981085 RepID=W9S1K9_9ROSA|nr:putative protein phosphatase 2C 14 [Morus notabilis]
MATGQDPNFSPSTNSNPTDSSSLKRKRPPSLEIPTVLREVRTHTPPNDVFSFAGLGVAVFSRKGKKKSMEDTHRIFSCFRGNSDKRFFGVYDGHGGKKAAEFVAENLHNNVLEMMENCKEKDEAVKAGYLKTDQDFLKQGLSSGACCVTAVIEGEEVVVSNLGDCRAVLFRGGVAEPLTKDHRVEQEDERKRIENKGGYVEIHRGAWRVHGLLTVSRSIGDAHLKNWVLAEPETKILQLTPDMEFLVLASDGLWEKVGNQEAVDTVKRLCSAEKKMGSSGCCPKDNDSDYVGCANVSPSSKLRRISLFNKKQAKGLMSRFSSHKKDTTSWIDSENDFLSKKESPPSKSQRISMLKQVNTKMESPTKENSDYDSKKNTCSWGDSENDIVAENEGPPSKSRRISLVKRVSMKTESPTKENNGYNNKKRPESDGLVAACKELVNLAVSRGGLDDITVMIINLNHFKLNRCSVELAKTS